MIQISIYEKTTLNAECYVHPDEKFPPCIHVNFGVQGISGKIGYFDIDSETAARLLNELQAAIMRSARIAEGRAKAILEAPVQPEAAQ